MKKGSSESYRVFVRNWWRWDTDSTGQRIRVPGPGPQKTIATNCTYDEAMEYAKSYNATHKPGPLSRKAEFDKE